MSTGVAEPKNASSILIVGLFLSIVWVKNTVENVDWIFPKTVDQSDLVKIVLIVHNKCSQADIAQNFVNRSHAEQHVRIN